MTRPHPARRATQPTAAPMAANASARTEPAESHPGLFVGDGDRQAQRQGKRDERDLAKRSGLTPRGHDQMMRRRAGDR